MNTPVLNHVAPAQQHFWDWRAAGNYIGGGSGAGVLLYAALEWRAAPGMNLLGLALVGLGLLCVWAEIGRPFRALNVFLHAKSSWMTREAMVATVLLPAGLAASWFGSRPLAWLTAVLALAYVYCQARMIQGARGIPAWRHPRTVPLMVATGLTEGAGLAIAFQAMVAMQAPAAWGAPVSWAQVMLAGLVLVRALAFAAWRSGLAQAGAPRRTHAVLAKLRGSLLALDVVVVGLIAFSRFAPQYAGALIIAGIVAALAGWWFKFTLVTRAAYHQGLALPLTPVRGAGTTHPGARPGW